MTIFEWIVLGWLAFLTVWLWLASRKPDNERIKALELNQHSYRQIAAWEIQEPMMEILESSKFMTKLIHQINGYQLTKGDKLGED